jgi:hypothetical protein
MRSVDILGLIATILFHLVVTLPFSTFVNERYVTPWVRAQAWDLPDLWLSVCCFVVIGVAFALRAHVIGATAHEKRDA